ncbi:MAG: hypothetical protein FJZ56_02635, partial [Chlamydiae bacterium]|nr:hypothetical protein [Chlamydiota bacterium]
MTTNTDYFNSDPFEDVFLSETDSTPLQATELALETDLFSTDIFGSDPFANFNEQIEVKSLQNRVETITVIDADQYIGDMLFSDNPLAIFHSIPSSSTRQEVLRKMLSIETFRDLLLVEENYETFKDPK